MKRHKNIYSYIGLGLLSLTIVSGAILSSPLASADNSATNDITINVPISCNLSSSTTTNHTATVDAGTYRSEIGESTITATCNDSDGFAIYAIGYSGDTYGNNTLINTTNSNYTIATGTATSGATSNWAMKLSAVTGTYEPIIVGSTEDSEKEQNTPDFSNYTSIPSTYTKVVYRNSLTDQSTGANFKTTYAAYVNPTQFTGTYEGKVKYTLVHPASEAAPRTPLDPGSVTYYPNGDNVVGTMGEQEIATNATSITLLASNYSRQGYGFAGWSDVSDYATNQNAHFYGPNEDITFTAGQYTGINPGLTLYAVWIESAGSLQDSTKVATLCGTGTGSLTQAPIDGTANLASVSALTDSRDNQTYAIAKLADGKCWMIENLRLESTNSDNSTGSLAQGYHSSFAGLANAESAANFSDSTTANSLYSTDGSTTKTISGDYQGYRFPRYNDTNTSARATTPTDNSGSMYSYGNYYTWHAAIADTTHNGSNNTSSDTTSICPKGWRLPHGGQTTVNTTAEFYLLGKAIMNNVEPNRNNTNGYGYYGLSVGKTATAAFRSYPNNFLYSGVFNTSSAVSRGSHGSYWSSTAGFTYNSYHLYLYSSNVYPATYFSNKYLGFSIRCVSGS